MAAPSGGALHKCDAPALVLERMPLIIGEVAPAAVLALVFRSQRPGRGPKVTGDERKPRDATFKSATGYVGDDGDHVRGASGAVIDDLCREFAYRCVVVFEAADPDVAGNDEARHWTAEERDTSGRQEDGYRSARGSPHSVTVRGYGNGNYSGRSTRRAHPYLAPTDDEVFVRGCARWSHDHSHARHPTVTEQKNDSSPFPDVELSLLDSETRDPPCSGELASCGPARGKPDGHVTFHGISQRSK
jgi:hypothetical protein